MTIDFTSFFNPAAWGSWAPGQQGILNPQVQSAANAPQPSGAIANAPQILGANAPGAPTGQPPQMPMANVAGATPAATPPLAMLRSILGGGQSSPSGPTGNIGYGTGVGDTGPIPASPMTTANGAGTNVLGGSNSNMNNMMQKIGSSLLSQPSTPTQQIQMAKPVGPGAMTAGNSLLNSNIPGPGNPNPFAGSPYGMVPGMLSMFGSMR